MEWQRVIKGKAPGSGGYHDWKELLAKEGGYRCVYCSIHESRLGGARMFHVEHFRPKSKFPQQENSYSNLYYACAICNVFKSDDWPSEPRVKFATVFYPDPSVVSYGRVFRMEGLKVVGRNTTGRYLVARLHLNRTHLILSRRMMVLERRYREFIDWAETVLESDDLTKEDLRALSRLQASLAKVKETYLDARPYSPDDMR